MMEKIPHSQMNKEDVCVGDPVEDHFTRTAEHPTFKHQSSGIFQLPFLFLLLFPRTIPPVNRFYYSKHVSGADVAVHSFKED